MICCLSLWCLCLCSALPLPASLLNALSVKLCLSRSFQQRQWQLCFLTLNQLSTVSGISVARRVPAHCFYRDSAQLVPPLLPSMFVVGHRERKTRQMNRNNPALNTPYERCSSNVNFAHPLFLLLLYSATAKHLSLRPFLPPLDPAFSAVME